MRLVSLNYNWNKDFFSSNALFILGDEAASFTKEEMQQGKHTDYERLLHEQLFICQNHKEGR